MLFIKNGTNPRLNFDNLISFDSTTGIKKNSKFYLKPVCLQL